MAAEEESQGTFFDEVEYNALDAQAGKLSTKLQELVDRMHTHY